MDLERIVILCPIAEFLVTHETHDVVPVVPCGVEVEASFCKSVRGCYERGRRRR